MPTFVRTQEAEHEIGANGSFSLRVTSADVELRAVDGPVARVRATYELQALNDSEADALFARLQLRVERLANGLEVTEPKQLSRGIDALASLFGVGGSFDLRVSAEVPRSAELRYNGVSADTTANGFAGAQQYRTVSGDLVLTDVGGQIRVQGVSGDVSLRAAEPLDLEAGSVSGDLSVLAPRFRQLRVNSVSGDVELEGELEAGIDHRVETVSGDLTIGLVGDLALEVRGLSTDVDITPAHRAEGSRDRRRYIVGAGGPSLSFSSMSGDVSVRPARRAAAARPTAPASAPPSPPTPPEARLPMGPAEQLEILRAVERGELDVDEAARRLAGDQRA